MAKHIFYTKNGFGFLYENSVPSINPNNILNLKMDFRENYNLFNKRELKKFIEFVVPLKKGDRKYDENMKKLNRFMKFRKGEKLIGYFNYTDANGWLHNVFYTNYSNVFYNYNNENFQCGTACYVVCEKINSLLSDNFMRLLNNIICNNSNSSVNSICRRSIDVGTFVELLKDIKKMKK